MSAKSTPDPSVPAAPAAKIPDALLPAYASVVNTLVEITAVRRRAALALAALQKIMDDPAAASAFAAKGHNAAEALRTLRHAAAEPTATAADLPSDHG